ncbi:CHAT domain-containing protein, partial [Russula compacta]
LYQLACALVRRFEHTRQPSDLEYGTKYFRHNFPLLLTGHYLRPLAQVAMWNLTISQSIGSDTSGRLVEEINMCRALLNNLPAGRQYRAITLHVLATLLRQRYEYFGNEECLKEAELCTEALSLCQSEEIQSLRDTDNGSTSTMLSLINADSSMAGLEEEIRRSDERLAVAQPGDGGYLDAVLNSHLVYMIKFGRSSNLADLEEVTKSRQVLLSLAPNNHREVVDFAQDLQLAYMRSGREELLHKSIDICRSVLESQSQQASRFKLFRILGTSLSLLYFKFGHLENLNESIAMFQTAFEEDDSDAYDRLHIACFWASVARYFNHPSTLAAYQDAMSAMHDSLVVGPTVQAQYTIIGNIGSHMQIPLEYASHQIERGQLEPAIEVLEEGRALLWSEMRGLRTSTDQLRKVHSTLADKFLILSNALEPRRLLQERRAIISQIRTIPGFEHFLKPVPFHSLRNAASHGPIIIINHCHWRCDIVIVLRDVPPSLIPTTRQFYKRAITLESRLFKQAFECVQEAHIRIEQYNRVLLSVLEELYEIVGRPVIDRLRELHIPTQLRIWWCPTSVFCSLPLHAMGPILSNDNQRLYFSDLHVCSYTPTLGALIASRTAVAQMSDPSPSLLMVGQPDAYLRGVRGELEVIRAVGIPVTGLVSEQATRAAVLQGLQKHRLVHFACQGTLEPGKPFDAAFELHGGDRLTLLDVVRSQLPVAEFAFLSACHTAELTDVVNPDEYLHLAAAMQYAGFHSVVGTMWAMADTDGRDLSAHFYRLMLPPDGDGDGDGDGSLCGRSARALRGAVQRLRTKEVTLERLVNFVHYGV